MEKYQLVLSSFSTVDTMSLQDCFKEHLDLWHACVFYVSKSLQDGSGEAEGWGGRQVLPGGGGRGASTGQESSSS